MHLYTIYLVPGENFMTTSCSYKLIAAIVCLGIALDNGINTFYYLNIEHWSFNSNIIISLTSLLLNGLLYHSGAAKALESTYNDIKSFITNPKIKSFIPYSISLLSAYVMAAFTMHNYLEGVIHLPLTMVYLFSFCYFVGTHTLIIQATKKNIAAKVIQLPSANRLMFFGWFSIFMVATASAVPQWITGIKWLTHNTATTNISAIATYIGEAFFVGQLSLWLSQVNIKKVIRPMFPIIAVIASLNAIGFACMTEYDSWITSILSNHTTFALGFVLSFFMMMKSLVELNK